MHSINSRRLSAASALNSAGISSYRRVWLQRHKYHNHSTGIPHQSAVPSLIAVTPRLTRKNSPLTRIWNRNHVRISTCYLWCFGRRGLLPTHGRNLQGYSTTCSTTSRTPDLHPSKLVPNTRYQFPLRSRSPISQGGKRGHHPSTLLQSANSSCCSHPSPNLTPQKRSAVTARAEGRYLSPSTSHIRNFSKSRLFHLWRGTVGSVTHTKSSSS